MDEFETAEKLAQIIEKGKQASELLHSPVFQGLVDELLGFYAESTFNTAPDEKAEREVYYHQHVAVQSLRGILESRVIDGEAAQAMLDKLELESNNNG